MTADQAASVSDWIKASGKNVTRIVPLTATGMTGSPLASSPTGWFTRGRRLARHIKQMHNNVAGREAVWDKGYPRADPAHIRHRDHCYRQPLNPQGS